MPCSCCYLSLTTFLLTVGVSPVKKGSLQVDVVHLSVNWLPSAELLACFRLGRRYTLDGACALFPVPPLASRTPGAPKKGHPRSFLAGWGKIWFKHHLYKGIIIITSGLNMFKPMGGPTLFFGAERRMLGLEEMQNFKQLRDRVPASELKSLGNFGHPTSPPPPRALFSFLKFLLLFQERLRLGNNLVCRRPILEMLCANLAICFS